FLPVKCDACKQDFCKDHFTYAAHKCPFAFQKDVQVPVCPLCNTPIPVKKGQIPDVVVSDHIDRDCDSHPGKKKEKDWGPKLQKQFTPQALSSSSSSSSSIVELVSETPFCSPRSSDQHCCVIQDKPEESCSSFSVHCRPCVLWSSESADSTVFSVVKFKNHTNLVQSVENFGKSAVVLLARASPRAGESAVALLARALVSGRVGRGPAGSSVTESRRVGRGPAGWSVTESGRVGRGPAGWSVTESGRVGRGPAGWSVRAGEWAVAPLAGASPRAGESAVALLARASVSGRVGRGPAGWSVTESRRVGCGPAGWSVRAGESAVAPLAGVSPRAGESAVAPLAGASEQASRPWPCCWSVSQPWRSPALPFQKQIWTWAAIAHPFRLRVEFHALDPGEGSIPGRPPGRGSCTPDPPIAAGPKPSRLHVFRAGRVALATSSSSGNSRPLEMASLARARAWKRPQCCRRSPLAGGETDADLVQWEAPRS
ncbi:hypothetical protein H8959_008276, partial [Pygathrix nigripes]